MNSEDALKAQAEEEKKALIKEWSHKLNDMVKQARELEQNKGKEALDR